MLCLTVATAMKLHALVNLLRDALRGLAVGGSEGGIVAKSATARRYFPITVGTGKTGIDGHLLHSVAEHTTKICRIGVESSAIAPGIYLHS